MDIGTTIDTATTWLSNYKEWVFSGIGLSVAGGLGSWWKRRQARYRSDTSILNLRESENTQITGGVNIQGSENVQITIQTPPTGLGHITDHVTNPNPNELIDRIGNFGWAYQRSEMRVCPITSAQT